MAKVFAFSPSFSFGFLAIGQMPGRWKLSLRPPDSKTAGTFQAGDGTDPQCRTGLDERPQGASGFTFPSEKKKNEKNMKLRQPEVAHLQILDDQATKGLLYSTETCVLHNLSI